jgi:hypothetical protein
VVEKNWDLDGVSQVTGPFVQTATGALEIDWKDKLQLFLEVIA